MDKVGLRVVARVTTAVAVCAGLATTTGCGDDRGRDGTPTVGTVRLGATFSARDSGLLDAILPTFEQKTGLSVETRIAGSSAALDAARRGDADVVFTNDGAAENAFLKDGFGLNRRVVMSNDFILLAPPEDPAGIVGRRNVIDALSAIREGGFAFVSRGDRSGTHARELSLWSLSGGEPDGAWYVQTRSGMFETLRAASDIHAYVLADRSTFRQHETQLALVVAIENDSRLANSYSVIAVNPARVPDVNFKGAMKLVEFLVSAEGQRIIGEYGVERFGTGLFVPMATR
jgi:tungstate transport system substrate-binding protein